MKTLSFLALSAVLFTCSVRAQSGTLVNTFNNPNPNENDRFGMSLCALGNDRLLIGAYLDDSKATNAGAVYLFNTNGTLLTTLYSPAATIDGYFGWSLAMSGTDRVLVGAPGDSTAAPNAGMAYLLDTNGALISSFSNPSPESGDQFGWALASVGADRVIIGAFQDDTGASDAGSAYLFSTNGSLLVSITNPYPAIYDDFGFSVAAVGDDRLLIGAPGDKPDSNHGGSVYLYRSDGAFLTFFTNPIPSFTIAGRFGNSVAVTENNCVLIGAMTDSSVASYSGAAYLFDTNGLLIATFTNPNPRSGDFFGESVKAIGDNRVLIGADGAGSGATNAGAAYLFNSDGKLIASYLNPAPSNDDRFGFSLAYLGGDRIVVGSAWKDVDATDSGVAYLFTLPQDFPSVSIILLTSKNAEISWSPPASDYFLQETEGLSPANWTNSPSGDANPVEVPTTQPTKFYRLIKP